MTVISCEDAIRLLMEHLDGALPQPQHAEVQRHLDACRACGSRAAFERKLREQLAALRVAELDERFEGRIRELVARFPVQPVD